MTVQQPRLRRLTPSLRKNPSLQRWKRCATQSLVGLALHFDFNFFYVDRFGFGIQSARDFGFLSRELADGILLVEAIDGFPGRKDEFASQILDAVERT